MKLTTFIQSRDEIEWIGTVFPPYAFKALARRTLTYLHIRLQNKIVVPISSKLSSVDANREMGEIQGCR